jgi:hypothetical protein
VVAPTPEAPAAAPDLDVGTSTSERGFSPGFEGGLRLGLGLPLGSAGRDAFGESRKVSDLAPWRGSIWVDAGYQASPGFSYGLYAQFGVDASGDACTGECDGSDLRVGGQAQWRLNPGAKVDPWLGIGVGLEAFSSQSLEGREDDDAGFFTVRTKELLLGPELLLQGGLELQVEDSLQLGPYLVASLGTYLIDDYRCDSQFSVQCPGGSSIDGSGFHAWIGLGVSGRYSP